MGRNQRFGIIFFLIAVAAGSYFLVSMIPRVLAEYEQAREFHPYWGYIYLGVLILAALAFLALAGWTLWLLVGNTWKKRRRRQREARNPSQMTRAEQEAEIRVHLAEGQQFVDDATLPTEFRAPIRQSVVELEEKIESQTLEIVAFGTISSGKSSLLNALAGREVFRTDPRGGTTIARNEIPWPGNDKVTLVDTPGLAEIDGIEREQMTRRIARDADLVLFVVDGPLRDFEHRLIEQLADMEKRVLICLNKADWYRDAERKLLTGQIAEQVRGLLSPDDILAVRAQPAARTRVRVLPDGTELEETVEAEPDISPLAERMMQIVQRDGRDLLLANLLLRSRGLVTEARQQVQTALDKRAHQLVDRTMWQAGGLAALSPLPVLDVAAGLAISTKMVLELARVYRQPMDLDTAGRLVGELGKNLVSILGASLATPAVGTAVASMLKTVPGVGTIAGGALQGLVQALVTRWIGMVFITYFRNEMREPEAGWAALARAKWSEVTRPGELTQFVKAGIARLGKKSHE